MKLGFPISHLKVNVSHWSGAIDHHQDQGNSDIFYLESHDHGFLGPERHSACGVHASMQSHTAIPYRDYGGPFKTKGEAYCQVVWYSCTTHARILLPRCNTYFVISVGKFFIIWPTAQTWPEVIFHLFTQLKGFRVTNTLKVMKNLWTQ